MSDDAEDRVRRHVRTLFLLDEDDRLLAVNEPGRPAAPRFLLVRTPTGNHAWYRHDLPSAIVARLDRLVAAEPVASVPNGVPPLIATDVRTILSRREPITAEWRGPAFAFPSSLAAPAGAGVETVTADRRDLLGEEFGALWPDLAAYLPFVVARQGAETVALCHAARRSATAAEAGVVTLPGYRRRGYGAAVVARWAREARAAGLEPLYSCAWENTASRGLARRLGLRVYAEDWHLT